MKCPHCHAEISDSTTACPYCGQNPATGAAQQNFSTVYSNQTNAQPTSQPAAPGYAQPNYQQTAQTGTPYYYGGVPNYSTAGMNIPVQKGKTPGEIAAIVIAVVVSVISVIAAMVIFVIYMERLSDKYDYTTDDGGSYLEDFEEYGIDDFTDEDSLDHLFDYYSSLTGTESQYPASAPAAEHTPVTYQDYLYSFSDGTIDTTYSVELDEVYRGEAALKLLEGAKLPDTGSDREIYLVKFKVTVTEQDTEAYVNPAPSLFTAAYSSEEEGSAGSQYDTLSYLDYKDNNQLLKKGESGTRWMAFAVATTDERPLIMWDKYEGEYFRYSKAAVSNATGLEAGAALESQSSVSSN